MKTTPNPHAQELGRKGGQALAQKWQELVRRAEDGDHEAAAEIRRRKEKLSRAGQSGGRPPRSIPVANAARGKKS